MRRIAVDIYWCSNVASFRLRPFVTKSCLVQFDASRWFDFSDLSFLPWNPSTVSREILRRTKPPILSGPIESYCTRDGLTPPHRRFPPRTGRTSWPETGATSPKTNWIVYTLKHTSQSGSCPEVKEISWNRVVHKKAQTESNTCPAFVHLKKMPDALKPKCASSKRLFSISNQKLWLSESIWLAPLHPLLMLESCFLCHRWPGAATNYRKKTSKKCPFATNTFHLFCYHTRLVFAHTHN